MLGGGTRSEGIGWSLGASGRQWGMVDAQHAERRDTLFVQARGLINADKRQFGEAGRTLETLFSEEYLIDQVPHLESASAGVKLQYRLDIARRTVIRDDDWDAQSLMDFRRAGDAAARQKAARLVVMAIILSADPDASRAISQEMCSFASVPWEGDFREGSDTWLAGVDLISWLERGWDDGVNPSPRVLDLLEEAMGVVRTGTNAAGGPLIPTGDGRPCDQPGLNPHDELHRALRDLLRHVSVFGSNASQWLETHQYDFGQKLEEQRDWLLDYTRQWWVTWEPAVKRVRDAIPNVQRPEFKDMNAEMLRCLAKLNGFFGAPLMYMAHEMPGDHLLVRPLSVLGFRREDDRYLVSNYPRERVGEAVRPIQEQLEALALYLEEDEADLMQVTPEVVPETKPVLSVQPPGKPMSYEVATLKALAKARSDGWPRRNGKPSVRRMAKKVGCSPHTMKKAIENSKELRHLFERDEVALPTVDAELADLILAQKKDARSSRAL